MTDRTCAAACLVTLALLRGGGSGVALPYDIIINPILDNSYKGISRLDFAPAARAAYNFDKTWAVAAEEYDDFGPLRGFYSTARQQHQLFGVFDYGGKPWSIEGGVGVGLTNATDHLVLKLILQRDLN